jgi:hypothetical protein
MISGLPYLALGPGHAMINLRRRGKQLVTREASGQALVEMAVAIGLSGFLVLMLSGMLSQTMLVSTASQNELIAAYAAEELLENARVMTYDEITNFIPLGQPISFVVNATGTASQTQLRPTSMPVQLDLTSTTIVYGEVNPSNTLLVNTGAKWGPGFGNIFSGTATETVKPFKAGSLVGYEIDIEISYNATYAVKTGAQNTKTLKRTAYVMNQGLNFQ